VPYPRHGLPEGIYALGAILSAVTVDAGMLLGARTLIGLAIGADSAIATAYRSEPGSAPASVA
jgi:MFS family permease